MWIQQMFKGNIITFPQDPTALLTVLPPPLSDLTDHIKVVFVGNALQPENMFAVRYSKVRKALGWLCTNNPLYRNITIDETNLRQMEQQTDKVLDAIWNSIIYDPDIEAAMAESSGYTLSQLQEDEGEECNNTNPEICADFALNPAGFADVEATTVSTDQMRISALQKLRDIIVMPHGSKPLSEYDNPSRFPSMMPNLYP